MVAGFLLILSTHFSLLTIERVGLSVGTAIWASFAILVSFSWGLWPRIQPSRLRSPLGCAIALLLLVTGVGGVIWSLTLSKVDVVEDRHFGSESTTTDDGFIQEPDGHNQSTDDGEGDMQNINERTSWTRLMEGMVCGMLVGVSGGSMLGNGRATDRICADKSFSLSLSYIYIYICGVHMCVCSLSLSLWLVIWLFNSLC